MKKAIDERDLIHAESKQFQRRFEQSKRIIKAALECGEWSVSFSGGKDSTVLLHLVREINPSVAGVFIQTGADFPETITFAQSIPNVQIIQPAYPDFLRAHLTEHCPQFLLDYPVFGVLVLSRLASEYGYKGPLKNKKWSYEDYKQFLIVTPMAAFNKANGVNGNFTGIRGDESKARKQMSKVRTDVWGMKNGTLRCEPLKQWSVADVWAYVASNNIEYNAIYDTLTTLGIERIRQRVDSFAEDVSINRGQWAVLRRGWPELYNRLAREFPHVAGYS